MNENMYDAWDNGDRHEIRKQFARREEIIRMARKAGKVLEDEWDVGGLSDGFYMDWAEEIAVRVAIQVAAAEREACARVCEEKEEYSMPISCPDGISGCLVAHYVPARREKTGPECAAAIRARGQA